MRRFFILVLLFGCANSEKTTHQETPIDTTQLVMDVLEVWTQNSRLPADTIKNSLKFRYDTTFYPSDASWTPVIPRSILSDSVLLRPDSLAINTKFAYLTQEQIKEGKIILLFSNFIADSTFSHIAGNLALLYMNNDETKLHGGEVRTLVFQQQDSTWLLKSDEPGVYY